MNQSGKHPHLLIFTNKLRKILDKFNLEEALVISRSMDQYRKVGGTMTKTDEGLAVQLATKIEEAEKP